MNPFDALVEAFDALVEALRNKQAFGVCGDFLRTEVDGLYQRYYVYVNGHIAGYLGLFEGKHIFSDPDANALVRELLEYAWDGIEHY